MSWERRKRLYIARLGLILGTIGMVFLIWLAASWMDTNIHSDNGSENQWNIFVIANKTK